MKHLIFLIAFTLLVAPAHAAVGCSGKISQIYKWDNFETISILVEIPNKGVTRWLSMPTKSDESMALMAFASNRDVHIYMSEDSVTKCVEGWPHNKKLKGYFVVK
jgi:hypothetical protein